MTGGRSSYGESYWRGYERGVQAGHAAGYAEGVAVLNAADLLAELRPSKTVEAAAARRRMAQSPRSSLTPREIRIQAAQSWGLPVPTDQAGSADLGEASAEPLAELGEAGLESGL